MTTSNSHAPWPGGCYEEAEFNRNCVRSSVTAGADLNHFATLPHAKTSWQSLKLQVTIATDVYKITSGIFLNFMYTFAV